MSLVLPGDLLAKAPATALNGTYCCSNGDIYSAIVGIKVVTENGVSVVSTLKTRNVVPKIGSIVLGIVKRVTVRFAVIGIMMVGSDPLSDEAEAVLRLENVREFEIDKVVMANCFRPGDVVRACVISLGDTQAYILSTASNDLGVIYAVGASGSVLSPISWTEMQCPETRTIEFRKVCKFSRNS